MNPNKSKFDLEKHLKFIEDVKNNPDLYKGTYIEQFYQSPNGVGTWDGLNLVCPNCLSNNGFYKIIGNRPDMEWSECLDCGWKGNRDDLVNYEDSINQKRFEKLNKILYE